MKIPKYALLLCIMLLSTGVAFAWLDPPTADEKAYFKDQMKNLTEKEFAGSGVVFGSSDLQASIYIYKKQTLPAEDWSAVFKAAFDADSSNWTVVYDYVIGIIKENDYYETFGYLNMDNKTYWINNVDLDSTSLSADLSYGNTSAGTISMSKLFWSFWTGSATIDDTDYKAVFLKFKDS